MNILVKKNGVVVEKNVYCGDVESVKELLAKKAIEDPSFTYEEVSDELFKAEIAAKEKSPEILEWESLKTANDRIEFLAKKIGIS